MTVTTPYAILVINIIDHYKIKWKGTISQFKMEEQYSSIGEGCIRVLNRKEIEQYEMLAIRFNYDINTYTDLGKNLMLVDYLLGRVNIPESFVEKLMQDVLRFEFLLDDAFINDTRVFTEKMLKNVIQKFPTNMQLLNLLRDILIRKLGLNIHATVTATVKEALNGRSSLIVRTIFNNIILDIINGERSLNDHDLKCVKKDIKSLILSIRPFDFVFVEISEKSKTSNRNLFYAFMDMLTLEEFLQYYINCVCYYDIDTEQYSLFIEKLVDMISTEGEYHTDHELERIYTRFLCRLFNNKLYGIQQDFIQRLFPLYIESTEVLRHIAIIVKSLCVKDKVFSEIPIKIRQYTSILPHDLIDKLRNMEVFYGIIQEKYDYPSDILDYKELEIYKDYFPGITTERLWKLLLFKHSYKSGEFLRKEAVQFYKSFCEVGLGKKNEEVEKEFRDYEFLNCSAESIIIIVSHK